MAWFILIISGAFEAVWAVALGASDGFRILRPTVIFAVAMVISMVGLAWAMRDISVGTAYAVWVGIGASGAVLLSAVTTGERVSAVRAGLLALLIASVVGLKVVS